MHGDARGALFSQARELAQHGDELTQYSGVGIHNFPSSLIN
jgi:hypothetical protein